MIPLQHLTSIISLKTREFWKNTNVFGFKTAENCYHAQNLPYVTVYKALIGQIFPRG